MRARFSIANFAGLTLALAPLIPNAAHAGYCGTQNLGFSAGPHTTKGSMAITISWAHGPLPSCTNTSYDNWDGLNHVEIWRVEGTTVPSAPGSGTLIGTPTAGGGSMVDNVFRSDKDYAYAMFACEDMGCTSWYGKGDGGPNEVMNNTSQATATDPEQWEITGITGESDTGKGAAVTADAQDPFVWYYPSGWGSGLSGYLAMYWSEDARIYPSYSPSELWYQEYSAAGWDAAHFNDETYWDTPVFMGEGSRDTSTPDDDHAATYPWALPVRDGTDKRMMLWMTTRYYDDPALSPVPGEQVFSMRSVDEAGDLALGSGDTFADADAFEVDVLAILNVENARTGRFTWNYLTDPILDLGTDTPPSLWLNVDNLCDGHQDVVRLDPTWSTDHYVWGLNNDSSGCPVVWMQDRRIMSIVPMPNGEFKAYIVAGPELAVIYWDGSTWDDEVAIDIVWDGSSSGPDHPCVENPNAFAMVASGVPHQGMFFRLMDSESCTTEYGHSSTLVGYSDGSGDDSSIVFAELTNG